MKRNLTLLLLSFRNQKALYSLPLFVDGVLLSLLNWYYYSTTRPPEMAIYAITAAFQVVIPVFLIWWSYLVLREEIEGESAELLKLYDSSGFGLCARLLLTWAWYLLHIAVLLLIYSLWFDGMLWEFWRLAVQSLFFVSALYLLSVLTRSTGIAMMVVLIYYFMTAFFSQDNLFSQLTIFTTENLANTAIAQQKGAATLYVSLLFLFGAFCKRKMENRL